MLKNGSPVPMNPLLESTMNPMMPKKVPPVPKIPLPEHNYETPMVPKKPLPEPNETPMVPKMDPPVPKKPLPEPN